jgi:hypothetical protein
MSGFTPGQTQSRENACPESDSGGSVKAEGLGDGPSPAKIAIAKLRLTLPPTTRHDFAFALGFTRVPLAGERELW